MTQVLSPFSSQETKAPEAKLSVQDYKTNQYAKFQTQLPMNFLPIQ